MVHTGESVKILCNGSGLGQSDGSYSLDLIALSLHLLEVGGHVLFPEIEWEQ